MMEVLQVISRLDRVPGCVNHVLYGVLSKRNCEVVRLSLQADYSLRTLMFLAAFPGRATVSEVAKFYKISDAHVAKVVNQLVRSGYIRGIRGVGGGLELAKSAESISIGEVIVAVEGHNTQLMECVSVEHVCAIQPACLLRGVFAKAEQVQLDYLKSVRLKDVLPTDSPGELFSITAPVR